MEQTEKVTPALSAIKQALGDGLVRYEIAAASERQERDRWLALCSDALHDALEQVGPIDPMIIHAVIDIMEKFLNRAGGRRK